MKGVHQSQCHTINRDQFNAVCTDENGAYINSRSTKIMYFLQFKEEIGTITAHTVHRQSESYFYNKCTNGYNTYEKVTVTDDNIDALEKYYRENRSIPGIKRIVVRIKHKKNSCVIYSHSDHDILNR